MSFFFFSFTSCNILFFFFFKIFYFVYLFNCCNEAKCRLEIRKEKEKKKRESKVCLWSDGRRKPGLCVKMWRVCSPLNSGKSLGRAHLRAQRAPAVRRPSALQSITATQQQKHSGYYISPWSMHWGRRCTCSSMGGTLWPPL